jgi:CRISPR/Cas system CMR-associated protein Cmr5 small subunit
MKHFILSVDEINKLQMENEAYKQSEQEASEIIAELKHTLDCKNGTIETLKAENERLKEENERLSSWLASSEKQRKEVCNVIHKKKEQIQTLKYMLFDEKEIPKDKFTMYYRIAQNERRTKSHRDLCINIVKKHKQTLQEIKAIAEDAYENESEYQATGVYSEILQKITKAEEE